MTSFVIARERLPHDALSNHHAARGCSHDSLRDHALLCDRSHDRDLVRPHSGDGLFSAVFGDGRGRSIENTLAARHPTEAARRELAELVAAKRLVNDETLLELRRYRHQHHRPLIKQLHREVAASLVRSGRVHHHQQAKVALAACRIRGGYSHQTFVLPEGTNKYLPQETGDQETGDQERLLHVWTAGEVTPLSRARKRVTFACGLSHDVAPSSRARSHRLKTTRPCRGCLAVHPQHVDLQGSGAHLDELWSSTERTLFVRAARKRMAHCLNEALLATPLSADEARFLGRDAWLESFCVFVGHLAHQSSARILMDLAEEDGEWLTPADVSSQQWASAIRKVMAVIRSKSSLPSASYGAPTRELKAALLNS